MSKESPVKLFEFTSQVKRVMLPDGSRKIWRLRMNKTDFPENTRPTTSGSVVVPDSDDVFYDFKQMCKDVTVPDEYYKCEYTLNETYVEFTSFTETGLRLGLFQYFKSKVSNLNLTMTRQWRVKGFEVVESDVEPAVGPGLFDGDDAW